MKLRKGKNLNKMKKVTVISILFLLIVNFIMPNYSRAAGIEDYLLSPIASLMTIVGDSINNLIYMSIAQTDIGLTDLIPSGTNRSYIEGNTNIGKFLKENGSSAPEDDNVPNVIIYTGDLSGDYGVPNIRISPAEIFSNKIAMLNANYFDVDQGDEQGNEKKSIVNQLRVIVASWYTSLRRLAVVGLLSVLAYIGIRIIISASATDKAKYKEMLKDWLVALCLVYCLHYIMAFTMTFVDEVIEILNRDTVATANNESNSEDFIEKQVHIQVMQGSSKNPVTVSNEVNELVTAEMDLWDIRRAIEAQGDLEQYSYANNTNLFKSLYYAAPELFKVDSADDMDKAFYFASGIKVPAEEINRIHPPYFNKDLLEKAICWYVKECNGDLTQGIIIYRAALYATLTDYQKGCLSEEWSYDYSVATEDSNEKFRNLYERIKAGPEEQPKDGTRITSGVLDTKNGQNVEFYTNLIGYMRLLVESKNQAQKITTAIMYLALTFYTVYFVFIYLKRILVLTFLTVIAPLVALTYPIDKIRDSKAQAFNYWLKEYIGNAMLPVIHSLVYSVLVTSAIGFSASQPLYAICALGLIVECEKLIKDMFGLNTNTAPKLGSFAGGVAAVNLMQKFANKKAKVPTKDSKTSNKIRTTKPKGIDSSMEDFAAPYRETQARNGGNQTHNNSPTAPSQQQNGQGHNSQNQPAQTQNGGAQNNQAQNNHNQNDTNGQRAPGNNGAPNIPEGNAKPEGKTRIRDKAKNVGHNMGVMFNRRFNLPGGRDSVKEIAKRAGKGVVRVGTGAAFAGIGLAGGMVSGNMNDMWKGLAGGAVAGKMAGGKLVNSLEGATEKIADTKHELLHGEEYAAREASNREFIKDPENIRYMRKYHPELKGEERKEYMRQMNTYKISGASEDMSQLDQLVQYQKEDVANGMDEEIAIKRNIQLGKYSKNVSDDVYIGKDSAKYLSQLENVMKNNGVTDEAQAKAAAKEMWERSRKLHDVKM